MEHSKAGTSEDREAIKRRHHDWLVSSGVAARLAGMTYPQRIEDITDVRFGVVHDEETAVTYNQPNGDTQRAEVAWDEGSGHWRYNHMLSDEEINTIIFMAHELA